METVHKSAGDCVAISSAAPTGSGAAAAATTARHVRDGQITIVELAKPYMRHYTGRDGSRLHRIAFWSANLSRLRLAELTDDNIYFALQDLAATQGRYWCGQDVDGRPNNGKLLGQKPPLKLLEIWAIRIRLQLDHRARELALFNLAIAFEAYLGEDCCQGRKARRKHCPGKPRVVSVSDI